jgi:hypothetical protein
MSALRFPQLRGQASLRDEQIAQMHGCGAADGRPRRAVNVKLSLLFAVIEISTPFSASGQLSRFVVLVFR